MTGSVTVDNAAIAPGLDPEKVVTISADMLPLWYTTILELEKCEVVCDSLRAALQISANTAEYYARQLQNAKKQSEKLSDMIMNMQEQNKVLTGDADSMQKYYLRWRLIGRVSIGVAILSLIVGLTN